MIDRNIYAEAKERWNGIGLKYEEEYFTNGGVAFEFEGCYEAICAMSEVMNYIDEWGLEGEYHITYSQRWDDDADTYIYRILIEEL